MPQSSNQHHKTTHEANRAKPSSLKLPIIAKQGNTLGSIIIATTVANLLSLLFPLSILQVYDRVIPNKAMPTMIMLAMAVVFALFFENILRFAQNTLTQWLDAKFEYQYDIHITKILSKIPIHLFRSHGLGYYLQPFEQLQSMRNFYACQALTALINMPFVLVFLALITFIGGWLVMAPMLVIVLIAFTLLQLSKTVNTSYKKKSNCDSHLTNFTLDTIDNIHFIKAQALESQMMRRYEMLYLKKNTANMDEWKPHALQLTRQLGSQIIIAAIAMAGAPLVIAQSMTVGGLAACIILSSRCVQPLNAAAQTWIRLQTVKAAQSGLQDTLDHLPQDQTHNRQPKSPLHFKLRSVVIDEGDETSHHQIDLDIPACDTISIQGTQGSGKSKLLKLLTSELHPKSGLVELNNQPLKSYMMPAINQRIAYIAKHSTLFHDSIMDNLTHYDPSREKEAMAVSQALGLKDHIEHMPKGFSTILSGQTLLQMPTGVKQMIHIASGLIRPSECILFDEANIYLSIQADQRLIQYLKSIKGQKTIVLVTQRPSLIALADKHYKFNNHMLEAITSD